MRPTTGARRIVDPLDIVKERYVGVDVFPARGDVIDRKALSTQRLLESLAESVAHGVEQDSLDFLHRTGREGTIGGGNAGMLLRTDRLEARVRLALTFAMNTDQRLEEPIVGELPGVPTLLVDVRLVEREPVDRSV